MNGIVGFFPSDFDVSAPIKGSVMYGDISASAEHVPAKSEASIDIVDVMYELLQMRKPDAFVDVVLDQMVQKKIALSKLTISRSRFRSWLISHTPSYTGSEKALNLFANRLGYRVDVNKVDGKDLYVAQAYDVTKRKRAQAVGHIAGSAGILAVLRLAIREQEKI